MCICLLCIVCAFLLYSYSMNNRDVASTENDFEASTNFRAMWFTFYPIGSMVLLYMVTWIPSIYPIYVSIYSSTMDPMGMMKG